MRAMIVALLVLASARNGAANESPRDQVVVPPDGYKLSEPKLGDHDHDHGKEGHNPLALLFILGGEVGYLPAAHHVNRAAEFGFEVELHLGRFKATLEGSLVVNSKFQGAIATAAMGVVHSRVALGLGGILYLGIERGVGRPSFDGILFGPAIDIVVTSRVQTMCVVGPVAEPHEKHMAWGVLAACHVALLLAGEPHKL